jgi:hypothetical protein
MSGSLALCGSVCAAGKTDLLAQAALLPDLTSWPTRYQRCRKRKQLMAHNRGFVIINDRLAVLSQLARYLTAADATTTSITRSSRGKQLRGKIPT